jgi:hypothetical protein
MYYVCTTIYWDVFYYYDWATFLHTIYVHNYKSYEHPFSGWPDEFVKKIAQKYSPTHYFYV